MRTLCRMPHAVVCRQRLCDAACYVCFAGVLVIIVWKIVDPQGVEDADLNVPDQVVDPLASDEEEPAPAERRLAATATTLRSLTSHARGV